MQVPEQIGRYEVRATVGEGGMAVVLEAWDPVLNRRLAIKLVDKERLKQTASADALRRFKREAQAAARLTHPNVVQVYEYGEDDVHAWIAMEFVPGKPLTEYVDTMRSDPLRARDILGQLLDALAYSHGQGVVHRDIKPSNLLLTPSGDIKVTDFGIARVDSSLLTQRGDMLGTPSYMSPEQYMGEPADGRADLFSAGVILYELLVGRKPFPGDSSGQIMQKVLHDQPVDPSQLNASLPPPIDWVLQKALAKDPDDRFQNAQAFHAALLSALPDPVEGLVANAGNTTGEVRGHGLMHAARKLRTLSRRAQTDGAASPDTGSTTGPASVAQRSRVLFVDDDERILSALRNIFRSRYQVLTAANGADALVLIEKFKIPVIVSDQRMPGMQGVELLRRARELAPDSVRILLTGYSDLAATVGSINDGEVYRFISKPWDNQELQNVIAEAVQIGKHMLRRPQALAQLATTLDAAILALDEGEALFATITQMAGQTHELVHVKTIQEALALLDSKSIALLLADIDAEAENFLLFLNLLKREQPEVLAIVVTSASDSELVIHLINEAQIYRFLNKPVNLELLEQYVRSALSRYVELKRSPELLERYQVEQSRKVSDSAFGQGLIDRLRALKRLVG